MSGSSSVERPAGSALALGDVVAEKYRIEREIGRGGMGIVFAATHMTLDRLVAIKVMKADLLEDPRALKRLMFEAKSAAKIKSEHVAKVIDVGTLPGGIPYIVMEFLDGQDLGLLIDSSGALSVQQSVTFVLQACEALAEVHVANLVHRDLKPGNLFIAKRADGSPSLKIVDFGISKYVGGPGARVAKTTSPHVLGSPFYMAPEQMRADAVDARSDIWALGAILFEMLTARTPFSGETLPEVYAAVLGDPPPSVRGLQPSVPEGLETIVHRCLEKDPFRRYANVADLARELAPYGDVTAQQSVERISRVLNQDTDGEADRLLGRASDVPTFQSGTPLDLVPPEQGLAEVSAAEQADAVPDSGDGYPPDGSEDDASVQAEWQSGSYAERSLRPEKTVQLRDTHARNNRILQGSVAAVIVFVAIWAWPGSESEPAIEPNQQAQTLLPVEPVPEVARAAERGLVSDRAAEVSGGVAGAKTQEPTPVVSSKPSVTPVERAKAPQVYRRRPRKSRSVNRGRRAAPKSAEASEQDSASSRMVQEESLKSTGPRSSGRKGKKDYWDSDSFGARR